MMVPYIFRLTSLRIDVIHPLELGNLFFVGFEKNGNKSLKILSQKLKDILTLKKKVKR